MTLLPIPPDTLTALRTTHADAVEAWLWHDEEGDRRAGHGHHMGQMLYRLPRDKQTDDMKASIEQMVAALGTLLDAVDPDTVRRIAYQAFNAGATACYDIPAQRHLNADFERFMQRITGEDHT
jgi:hypothetical protein